MIQRVRMFHLQTIDDVHAVLPHCQDVLSHAGGNFQCNKDLHSLLLSCRTGKIAGTLRQLLTYPKGIDIRNYVCRRFCRHSAMAHSS